MTLIYPRNIATYLSKGVYMRKDLINILACPLCKEPLVLRVYEEDEQEVIKGALLCDKCHESYPIEDAIPNLLPPQLRK